jgi:hypothetical protein
MDAVENFVGAAHEAVKTKPCSEIRAAKAAAAESRPGALHAVGDFLKAVFGPEKPGNLRNLRRLYRAPAKSGSRRWRCDTTRSPAAA